MKIIFASEEEKKAFIIQMLGENCPSDLLLPEDSDFEGEEPDCIGCWNHAVEQAQSRE